MPRRLELNVPGELTEQVIAAINQTGQALTLTLQRGISLTPPGDVVALQVTSDGARSVIRQLRESRLYQRITLTSEDIAGLVQPSQEDRLRRESSESTWTEIAFFIRGESNVMLNYLAFMFLAGGVVAVGLWKNAPHIVVGAMLIAPALLPLLRIPFGLVGRDRTLAMRGITSTLTGYGAVILGALATTAALRLLDPVSLEVFRSHDSVQFWSTLRPASVVLAMAAAAAGAFAVTSRRVVPLSGVLIAVDLVPATGMAGMSMVLADFGFAVQNLARAAVDIVVVLAVGGLVFAAKHRMIHHHADELPG